MASRKRIGRSAAAVAWEKSPLFDLTGRTFATLGGGVRLYTDIDLDGWKVSVAIRGVTWTCDTRYSELRAAQRAAERFGHRIAMPSKGAR